MDEFFSMDEMDHFWSPFPDDNGVGKAPLGMNRSSSELALQQFLQEASVDATNQNDDDVVEIIGVGDGLGVDANQQQLTAAAPDPEECHAFLKSRLELECAAVALLRGEASAAPNNGSHVAHKDSTKLQGKVVLPPPLPVAEGGNQSTQNVDPTEARRLANRESARRSRIRKQAQLSEIETRVSQLQDEQSSLLKQYNDIFQKMNEESVDNRVLMANCETVMAKVKMSEELVKSVAWMNPLQPHDDPKQQIN